MGISEKHKHPGLCPLALIMFVVLFFLPVYYFAGDKVENVRRYPKPGHVSMYYWKTTFKLTHDEQIILQDMHVRTLYVRYFDVVYDPDTKSVRPESPLIVSYDDIHQVQCDMVPVIYITKEALERTKSEDIPRLAFNMARYIIKTAKVRWEMREIQLDCDWTPEVKDKYFQLIREFSGNMPQAYNWQRKTEISVTLRLHQIKYSKASGIPPVQKASLMMYNIRDLGEYTEKPAMFDMKEMTGYLKYIKKYPIRPAIILPIYSSVLLYRAGRLKNIFTEINPETLADAKKFKKINDSNYSCVSTFFYKNTPFRSGDILKFEKPTIEYIKKAYSALDLKDPGAAEVGFYQLDEASIKEVTNGKIDSLTDIYFN